jgi:hypothetical protein
VLAPPTIEDLLRRPSVEAGVDLRAAARATTLGVGDGRTAQRRRDAAGPVLAIHLVEREGHDLALAHELALLEDDDVQSGLGENGRRRGAAGA